MPSSPVWQPVAPSKGTLKGTVITLLCLAISTASIELQVGDSSTFMAALRDPAIDLITLTDDTIFLVTPPPDAALVAPMMMRDEIDDSNGTNSSTSKDTFEPARPPVTAVYSEPPVAVFDNPIALSRNLTIRGSAPASGPLQHLDFRSVRGALLLQDRVTLTLEYLELEGMFGVFDLYPTTFQGSSGGTLVVRNCTDHRKVCQPLIMVHDQLVNLAMQPPPPFTMRGGHSSVADNVLIRNSTSCSAQRGGVQFCLDQTLLLLDWAGPPDVSNNANYSLHGIAMEVLCDVFVTANGTFDHDNAFFPDDWSLDLRVVLLPLFLGGLALGVSASLTVWVLRRRHRRGKRERQVEAASGLSRESTAPVDIELGLRPTMEASSHAPSYRSDPIADEPMDSDDLVNGRDQFEISSMTMPSGAITLGPLLGVGSFGRVYKGTWRGQAVAVKVIPHPASATERVQREVDIMMRCPAHPNVLRAVHYQVFSATWSASDTSYDCGQSALSNMETWLVLEYCDLGCLATYLGAALSRRPTAAPDPLVDPSPRLLQDMRSVLLVALDVARGMACLHSMLVCHGDLKCENVLLCSSPEAGQHHILAKVADFGLSQGIQLASHLSTTTVGTVTHMPPELLMSGQLRPSCDVYSFGILLWQLVTGCVPYKDMRYAEIVYKVAVFNMRPVFPDRIPVSYQQLATDCWRVDPCARLTFEQIIPRLEAMLADVHALQHSLEQWAPSDQMATDSTRSRDLPSPFSDLTLQSLLASECLSSEEFSSAAAQLLASSPCTSAPQHS